MIIKLRRVVVLESIIIVALIAALITNSYSGNAVMQQKIKIENNTENLLSPRIYAGLLEPKSFMIVDFTPLKLKILEYTTKNHLNMSVYVENFRNGAFMGINERAGFFPTSLNKLPVAILIMHKIENGELSLGTMLQIKDSDRTDSSGELYKTKEKEISVQTALEKLLRESDNTALRILLRQASIDDLQFILDYYGMNINVDVQKKQNGIKEDLISPKSVSNLFSSLYFSTVLEPQNSEYLLSLMTDTLFPINEVANLPDNVKVVQKFGNNYYGTNQFFHDCGILYIDESRLFYCIMTQGTDEQNAIEAIGVTVNKIYHYVKDTKARLEAYKKG